VGAGTLRGGGTPPKSIATWEGVLATSCREPHLTSERGFDLLMGKVKKKKIHRGRPTGPVSFTRSD